MEFDSSLECFNYIKSQAGKLSIDTPNRFEGGCCPAHESEGKKSFGGSITGDGDILLKCFAGCELDDILLSLELEHTQLFSENYDKTEKPAPVHPTKKKVEKVYKCYTEFTDFLKRQNKYKDMTTYLYYDKNPTLSQVAIRLDQYDGKKEFRQMYLSMEGWKFGSFPGLLMPFNFARCGLAEKIYVVEGEKCVFAMEEIGLTAITSIGGSSAPQRTDWSMLNGEDIVIIPDNDGPGFKYASYVANKAREFGANSISVINLPVKQSEDVADWISSHNRLDPEIAIDLEARSEPYIFATDPDPEPEDIEEPKPHQETLEQFAEIAGIDLGNLDKIIFEDMTQPMKDMIDINNYYLKFDIPSLPLNNILNLSSILIGQTACVKNRYNTRANIYTICSADSGYGKNSIRNVISTITDGARPVNIVTRSSYYTPTGIEKTRLTKHDLMARLQAPLSKVTNDSSINAGLFEGIFTNMIDDEFEGFLSKVNSSDEFSKDTVNKLTQLMQDSSDRTITKQKASESSRSIKYPYLSVSGMIQPKFLQENITEELVSKGFFTRCLWFTDAVFDQRKKKTEKVREQHERRFEELGIGNGRKHRLSLLFENALRYQSYLYQFAHQPDKRRNTDKIHFLSKRIPVSDSAKIILRDLAILQDEIFVDYLNKHKYGEVISRATELTYKLALIHSVFTYDFFDAHTGTAEEFNFDDINNMLNDAINDVEDHQKPSSDDDEEKGEENLLSIIEANQNKEPDFNLGDAIIDEDDVKWAIAVVIKSIGNLLQMIDVNMGKTQSDVKMEQLERTFLSMFDNKDEVSGTEATKKMRTSKTCKMVAENLLSKGIISKKKEDRKTFYVINK